MDIRVKTFIINKDKSLDGHDTITLIKGIVENKFNSIIYEEDNEDTKILRIPFIYTGIDSHLIDKSLSDCIQRYIKLSKLFKNDYTSVIIDSNAPNIGIRVSNKLLDTWWDKELLYELSLEENSYECSILDLYSNSKLTVNKKNKDENMVKYLCIAEEEWGVSDALDFASDIDKMGCIANCIYNGRDVSLVVPYIELGDEDIYLIHKSIYDILEVKLSDASGILYRNYKNKVQSAHILYHNIDLHIISEGLVKLPLNLLATFDMFY